MDNVDGAKDIMTLINIFYSIFDCLKTSLRIKPLRQDTRNSPLEVFQWYYLKRMDQQEQGFLTTEILDYEIRRTGVIQKAIAFAIYNRYRSGIDSTVLIY